MKRKTIFLIVGIIIVVGLLLVVLTFQRNDFSKLKSKRESVVGMIYNGELLVKENGCVVLPDDLKKVSDSGECFIVEFDDKTAIYFLTYRGILESSKGYVYLTDKINYKDYIDTNKYAARLDYVNLVELEDNWYSCST